MKQSTLLGNSPIAHASQTKVAECLDDNRRLEFLRALSCKASLLSGEEAWFVDVLLERARQCEFHYRFKFAERTITDALKKTYGELL